MAFYSTVLFALVSLFASVSAEKASWESTRLDKAIAVRSSEHRLLYQGIAEASDCFSQAEKLSGKTVQFHNATKVCDIYQNEISDDHLGDSSDYFVYRAPKDIVSSHKMTAGDVVFTIIWCILVVFALGALAIFCRRESVPVYAQLSRIQKREAQIEEAVSEEWERKSAMEEMTAQKKEAEAI